MLFLQGSRDAFARRDLLAATLAGLPAATLHTVDGGDHGLKVQGRSPEDVMTEIVEVAVRWTQQLPEGPAS
jgi:predicted alpha/beta-hydrolase family hydrolase